MSRPAKLIIHTNAFKHNLNVIKAYSKDAKIWACVKASAYGHGIESVVEGLKDADGLAVLEVREAREARAFGHGMESVVQGLKEADGLAVLEIREAREARELGWEKPILLLEGIFSEQELDEICSLELEIVIHNKNQIEWCLRSKNNIQKIWIKINSGMNRLGFKG